MGADRNGRSSDERDLIAQSRAALDALHSLAERLERFAKALEVEAALTEPEQDAP